MDDWCYRNDAPNPEPEPRAHGGCQDDRMLDLFAAGLKPSV